VPRRTKKAEAVEPTAPEEVSADAAPADDELDSEAERPTVDVAQAVTFKLDGQLYGLPIGVVQEIQQLVEFTPLPDTSAAVVGLIDVRGFVVPAIDLRCLIGLPRLQYTLETPMIFCRVRGHVVCLVVDRVEDVVDLPPDGLQPPTSLYSMADRMLGMCRIPQGLVLMLDVDRLVPEAALAAADASNAGE
jgi:purine-binding chemotaxis protein CheW